MKKSLGVIAVTTWLLAGCGQMTEADTRTEASQENIAPDLIGATHSKPSFRLPCPTESAEPISIRARHEVRKRGQTQFVSTEQTVSGSKSNSCTPAHDGRIIGGKPRIPKINNDFRGPNIQLDTQYEVSVVDLNTKVRSEWKPFAMLSADDSTFSEDFGIFKIRTGEWQIQNGFASNSAAFADAILLADWADLPFVGSPNKSRAIAAYFKFSSACAEPPCRLSFIVGPARVASSQGDAELTTRHEVSVDNGTDLGLFQVSRGPGGKMNRRKLVDLGKIDPFALEHTLLIAHSGDVRYRIALNGKSLHCGSIPRSGNPPYVGVAWSASGDDDGDNFVEIERITTFYGTYTNWNCSLPTPRPKGT